MREEKQDTGRSLIRASMMTAGVLFGILLIAVAIVIHEFMTADLSTLSPDCPGTFVSISGSVVDTESHSIADALITVEMSPESSDSISLQTDERGYFTTGTENVHHFICGIVSLTVNASGYQTSRVSYELFDHYSEHELVDLMGSGRPIAIEFEVALERLEIKDGLE